MVNRTVREQKARYRSRLANAPLSEKLEALIQMLWYATLPSGIATGSADQAIGVPSPSNPAATVRHSTERQTP